MWMHNLTVFNFTAMPTKSNQACPQPQIKEYFRKQLLRYANLPSGTSQMERNRRVNITRIAPTGIYYVKLQRANRRLPHCVGAFAKGAYKKLRLALFRGIASKAQECSASTRRQRRILYLKPIKHNQLQSSYKRVFIECAKTLMATFG